MNAGQKVDGWNKNWRPGTLVRYWHTVPCGPVTDTATASRAFVMHGKPVIFLRHLPGYVALDHCIPAIAIDKSEPEFNLGACICSERFAPSEQHIRRIYGPETWSEKE